MASSIGNTTAAAIVDTDTLQLIYQANSIVQSCTGGPGCNTSPETRTSITQQLSKTAQDEANDTLRVLSLPSCSVLGRNIYNGYIDLAAAIASVYNYQCGNTTVNSTACVTNATSVQTAQDNLQSLISQPATDNTKHIIVLSILLCIAVIAFILFFVFFIIGLVGTLTIAPVGSMNAVSRSNGSEYMKSIEQSGQTPLVSQIAVPASPFDTTQAIYQ